jgi:hypothetical protein
MWLAYFEQAISDESVEKKMPITQHRRETDAEYVKSPLTHNHESIGRKERKS